MKKLLLVCLLLTGWSQAQNITFKDPAFKNYLANYFYGNYKLDINYDGEISVDEGLSLTYLNIINDTNIVSIDGIENFTNLTILRITDSKNIETVNVSTLLKLNQIDLSGLKKISLFKASDKIVSLTIAGGTCENIDFKYYPNLSYVNL